MSKTSGHFEDSRFGYIIIAIMFTLALTVITIIQLLFAPIWAVVWGYGFITRGLVGRSVRDVDKKAEPPIIAEFLVVLCVKRRYRNGLLQNLEEDFESNLAAGATMRRASMKYWAAALNSIGPQLLAAAKRIGIIGLVADYARRLLH